MTIADQIAELEARDREHQRENAELKRRLDKNAGALLESRAQNAQLIRELSEARELIGTYQTHFHSFHGSAEHIKAQEKALAAAVQPETAPAPAPTAAPASIKERIASIVKRNGSGEAA